LRKVLYMLLVFVVNGHCCGGAFHAYLWFGVWLGRHLAWLGVLLVWLGILPVWQRAWRERRAWARARVRARGGEGSCWKARGPAGWDDGVVVCLLFCVEVGVRVGRDGEAGWLVCVVGVN